MGVGFDETGDKGRVDSHDSRWDTGVGPYTHSGPETPTVVEKIQLSYSPDKIFRVDCSSRNSEMREFPK